MVQGHNGHQNREEGSPMRPSTLIRSLWLCLAFLFLGLAPAWALRFVVLSDTQGLNPAQMINLPVLQEVQERILALDPRPSFAVVTGDLALVGGEADGRTYFADWKEAMRPLTDAGIRVWPAVGNHDLYVNQLFGFQYRWVQEAFQKAFADLPDNGPADYERLAYAFEDPGSGSFFAVLDTYHIPKSLASISYVRQGHIRDEQTFWLAEKLAETTARHRFVFGHNPVYSPLGPVQACIGNWCDLWRVMSEGGARFYFCGHDHLYSRRLVTAGSLPEAPSTMLQVICPPAGGNPTPLAKAAVSDPAWHLWSGPGFLVVDVQGAMVTVTAWGKGPGGWERIDGFDVTAR